MDFLLDMARSSQAILEIGVRGGVSTSAFLWGLRARAGHLWSIDLNPDCARLYAGDLAWTFVCADSRDILRTLPELPAAVDLLFIDGGHEYETVHADLGNYAPLVREGGWILLHDLYPVSTRPRDSGVPEAYAEFLAESRFRGEILPGRFGLGVIKASILK